MKRPVKKKTLAELPPIPKRDPARSEIQRRYIAHVNRLTEQFIQKNTDYGSSFQKTVAGIPASKCCLIRLMDKVRRIENLMAGNDPQVKSETIADTLGDLSVYAILVQLNLEDEAGS